MAEYINQCGPYELTNSLETPEVSPIPEEPTKYSQYVTFKENIEEELRMSRTIVENINEDQKQLRDSLKILIREFVKINPSTLFEIMSSDLSMVSDEMLLSAVQQDGDLIRHIQNPLKEIQEAAVKQNGTSIQFIKNPETSIKFMAVEQDPDAIEYIDINDRDYDDLCHNALCDDIETLEIISKKGPMTKDMILRCLVEDPGYTINHILAKGICVHTETDEGVEDVFINRDILVLNENNRAKEVTFELLSECLREDAECLHSMREIIRYLPMYDVYQLCFEAFTHEKVDKFWNGTFHSGRINITDIICNIFRREGHSEWFEQFLVNNIHLVPTHNLRWILSSMEHESVDISTECVDKLCIEAMRNNPEAIRYIDQRYQSDDICRYFIMNCPDEDWKYLRGLIENNHWSIKRLIKKRNRRPWLFGKGYKK